MISLCYAFAIVFGIVVLLRVHSAVKKKQNMWAVGKHSLDELPGSLAQLLKRGYEGGFLIITFSPSKKCLWFQKYIRSKGDYGIEFAFPEADWSRPYFPKLKAYCIEQGMEFRIISVGAKGHELTGSLYVDFGKDIDRANEFSVHVTNHILGIPEDEKYEPIYKGFSRKDVLVDNIGETK